MLWNNDLKTFLQEFEVQYNDACARRITSTLIDIMSTCTSTAYRLCHCSASLQSHRNCSNSLSVSSSRAADAMSAQSHINGRREVCSRGIEDCDKFLSVSYTLVVSVPFCCNSNNCLILDTIRCISIDENNSDLKPMESFLISLRYSIEPVP